MTFSTDKPGVITLLGPTGVGKSYLAVLLAPSLEAEIISVDSMQIYRGMDIGTAKIDQAARQKVAHHIIDIIDPGQNYSAADFQEAARAAIGDVFKRKKIPFLVGGTGLYFEAAVFDMCFPPESADEDLRGRLEDWAAGGPDGLRRKLTEAARE